METEKTDGSKMGRRALRVTQHSAQPWLQGAGGAHVACWVGAQQTVERDPEVDVERGRHWARGGEGEARG